MTELQYGERTSVTISIPRSWVAGFSAKLLRRVSNVWLTDREASVRHVYLPDGLGAFGLVNGGATRPAWGSYTDLLQSSFQRFTHANGAYLKIKLAEMGAYFGWLDPSGMRFEFHTLDGATYKLSASYVILPLGAESYADETRKLEVVRWLIGLDHKPREAWATALTSRAAAELQFAHVQLTDPPVREQVLKHIPDPE
jgi:hypothetical protein